MSGFELTNVQTIKGVGPRTAAKLAQLEIFTVQDLLEHYPRSYDEYRYVPAIAELLPGHLVVFSATVTQVRESRPRRGLHILTVTVRDEMGTARLVWFNQPFLKKRFSPGERLQISGKVAEKTSPQTAAVEIHHPETTPLAEAVEPDKAPPAAGLLPMYSLCAEVSQTQIRAWVQAALVLHHFLPETLPTGIVAKYQLMDRSAALRQIHCPETLESADVARRRLIFEELYFFQCVLLMLKRRSSATPGIQHQPDGCGLANVRKNLPFALTDDQEQALREIKQDMESAQPMQRLLQGDVGSGKTVVAALALAKAVESGYQAALMVPTAILAEQHFSTLQTLLAPANIRLALLTGNMTSRQRRELLQQIADGGVDLIIGTHALIQAGVEFHRLGFVVTDEQHRFGVRQRAALQAKGCSPDVLIMTATPIPRTMALTLYGDLDVSVIRQLPPARKPVATYTRSEKERSRVYDFVVRQLEEGRQAYIVCPLVDESEQLSARSATQLFEELSGTLFAAFRCELIHGQLKGEEKEAAMTRFSSGHTQLLIATTVIEVGVNVPNANIIVIENADRFGLAQLHQLRGRVGRGVHQSYCILLSNSRQATTRQRLQLMTKTSDGFVLAEEDLSLRGPGHFFGALQHGLPELKTADLLQDMHLLEIARQAARETIETSAQLPQGMPVRLQNLISAELTR
ncbi:MAG TPA: ATP-dependent DNA helicase RecG [Patescibacteria group bacterium]|nr:ATP-dependent DNA helicase RecG [Patescibacteria group bacterium]